MQDLLTEVCFPPLVFDLSASHNQPLHSVSTVLLNIKGIHKD